MNSLEFANNIFQLITVLSVCIYAGFLSLKNIYYLPYRYLFGTALSWFIGTAYWTVYFKIFDHFPYYFSASELCYMGIYLLLISLSLHLYHPYAMQKLSFTQKISCLILPIFVLSVNTISYLMWGGLFWNLYYAIPLSVLGYFVNRNMFILKSHYVYCTNTVIICFVVFNNLMFLVSCFEWNTLYICFDFVATLTLPSILYFLKKECDLSCT